MDEFPEVSNEEAEMSPYPYVYILDDGSARELTGDEKDYLETPFHPGDSARPYIKPDYKSKTPDGSIRGYCPRYKLPKKIKVNP